MSDEIVKTVCKKLKEDINCELSEFRGDITIKLGADDLPGVLKRLRDEFKFEMLVDITAVDYWPQTEMRFHLVYHLFSMSGKQRLWIRVPLNGNAPKMKTVEGIYPNANWYERELYDLMGITFEGHSDLRRILMPADWEGHPLRKDYPLGYEEVHFTFNFDDVNINKPHPKA